MCTFNDGIDVQLPTVTVNVRSPGDRFVIVTVLVLPDMLPGLIVQLTVGKPLKTTEPVATAQVGCVIVPTVGLLGAVGCSLIATGADVGEVQLPRLTVNVYIALAARFTVVVDPVPVVVTLP